jgi:cytoskeletal protein CcmA (bactofilin family)
MFSSKSKDSTPVPSMPTAQTPVKRSGRSAAPSIISADLVVNGTLTSSGDIQIDGRVDGDVHSAGLVIGDKAFIQGEVLADDVTVRGKVHGSIRARKVFLASTCHVEGNILHEAFAVEAGAFFEGNCRHSDNPLSEEAKKSVSFDERTYPAPTAAMPQAPTLKAVEIPISRPVSAATATATVAPLKSGA